MTFYLPIWTWLKSCVGFVVLGYFLPGSQIDAILKTWVTPSLEAEKEKNE